MPEYKLPLEEQYLRIEGKISQSSFELVKSGLPSEKLINTEILFVGYSYADFRLGHSFKVIFPKQDPIQGILWESKVIAVTQQLGISTQVIPQGWKTICLFEFPQGVPDIIKNLPTINAWGENYDGICFCDEDVWGKQSKNRISRIKIHRSCKQFNRVFNI